MGHLIACEQDNSPQIIIPSPHMVFVSDTNPQPYGVKQMMSKVNMCKVANGKMLKNILSTP